MARCRGLGGWRRSHWLDFTPELTTSPVWRLPWYIPIVSPLEVCHTDQVGVQEAQVLSGQPPR